MQDVDFPRKGIGYLDIPRAESALRTAASLWLADGIKVYADGRALPPPTIAAVRVSLPSDAWFGSYDEAMAQLARPRLPADINLYWAQGMLDVRAARALAYSAFGSTT